MTSPFWCLTPDNNIIFPQYKNLMFTRYWWTFLSDDSKKVLLNGGRGAAKTFTVVFKGVHRAVQQYQNKITSSARRRPGGAQWILYIICPTVESYQPIIDYLDDMVPIVPGISPDGTKNYVRTNSAGKARYRLFGRNGIEIRVFSGFSADTLRGKGADEVILDEAFLIPRDAVESVIIPISNRQGGYAGYFTALGTPDTEVLKHPWFDRACDEADPQFPDRQGYFSDFKLYCATWLDNPDISDELYANILRERQLNPLKYERERMGVRGLVIQDVHQADGNVFSREMMSACYYTERVTVQNITNILIGIDLSYGGIDALVRMVIDKGTNSVIDMTIVDAKEIRSKTTDESLKTVRQFILDTASQYPGAQIIYDKSGRLGQSLPTLLPRHLKLRPIDRGNVVKNRQVETIIARMGVVDDNGRCTAIRFPSLESKWMTDIQRNNFKRFYVEMQNYWQENKIDKFGKITGVRYTKRAPFADDCMDALTICADDLNSLRVERKISLTGLRRHAR